MEFKNDALSAQFTIPDKLTVREQLRYASAVAGSNKSEFVERCFEGAKLLVRDWKCEKIPSLEAVDLDASTDPAIANIIVWVSVAVRRHVDGLERLPAK